MMFYRVIMVILLTSYISTQKNASFIILLAPKLTKNKSERMNSHDSCLNDFMGYFELDWAEVTLAIEKGPSQVTCWLRMGLGG